MPPRAPLPPPPPVLEADMRASSAQQQPPPPGMVPQGVPGAYPNQPPLGGPAGAPGVPESQECPVCLQFPKDTAFQCGHQVRAPSGLSSSQSPLGIHPTHLSLIPLGRSGFPLL